MSNDPVLVVEDFLKADVVLEYLCNNLAITFQTRNEEMNRETAEKHFKDREALLRVRDMLIGEAERIQ